MSPSLSPADLPGLTLPDAVVTASIRITITPFVYRRIPKAFPPGTTYFRRETLTFADLMGKTLKSLTEVMYSVSTGEASSAAWFTRA